MKPFIKTRLSPRPSGAGADGLHRRGREQRARVLPADLRAEARRAPPGAAAEGGGDATDLRAQGQGEGDGAQGGGEGGRLLARGPSFVGCGFVGNYFKLAALCAT